MRKAHGRRKTPHMLLALWAALSLIAVSVVGTSGSTAFAAAPVMAGGKAVVTNTGGDPIRVREGAGTDFAQIASAYEGQVVTVLDGPRPDKIGTPWYKIQAPAGTGWMIAIFLQGASAPTPAPTTAPVSAPTSVPTSATTGAARLTGSARVANTNGDSLRVRSVPSTSSNILFLLNPGAEVIIEAGPLTDAVGIVWYGVLAKGASGWAMAQYLAQIPEPSGSGAAANREPTATATATATPATILTPAPAATTTATAKPTEKPKPTPTAAPQGGTLSTPAQYRQWMEEARAIHPYKQSVEKMWSVMMCESGGNARASGGGGRWLGLFQYAPGTWGGSWNPYRADSIWDAKSQIFATAKAWSIGMQSHWSCYYMTPGR